MRIKRVYVMSAQKLILYKRIEQLLKVILVEKLCKAAVSYSGFGRI